MASTGHIVKIVENDSVADIGQIDFQVYYTDDLFPGEIFNALLTYETVDAAAALPTDIESLTDVEMV